MTDISQLLQQIGATSSFFSPSSRYKNIPLATIEYNSGETIVYVRRRFIPQADRFFILEEHTVTQGERLDNIANQYFGDPERFWQICDANNIIDPDELTKKTGNKIRITLPEGIPGNTNV
jgi:hypothetical protein